ASYSIRIAHFEVRLIWFAGCVPILARGLAEQPLADVLGHGPEPAVLDALTVVPAHRGVGVAHDEVDGHGVAGRIGDGAEDVPEGVKADPIAVQGELLEQLAELDTDIIRARLPSVPHPAPARPLEENQAGVGPVLRVRSLGE